MRVVVNFDTCQSNALCMGAAPEVFEVRDDGYLYVLNETPDACLLYTSPSLRDLSTARMPSSA